MVTETIWDSYTKQLRIKHYITRLATNSHRNVHHWNQSEKTNKNKIKNIGVCAHHTVDFL